METQMVCNGHTKQQLSFLVSFGGLSGKLLACRPSQAYRVVYSTEGLFPHRAAPVFLGPNHRLSKTMGS